MIILLLFPVDVFYLGTDEIKIQLVRRQLT